MQGCLLCRDEGFFWHIVITFRQDVAMAWWPLCLYCNSQIFKTTYYWIYINFYGDKSDSQHTPHVTCHTPHQHTCHQRLNMSTITILNPSVIVRPMFVLVRPQLLKFFFFFIFYIPTVRSIHTPPLPSYSLLFHIYWLLFMML